MSTSESKDLVARMIAALNEHVIEGQEEFWTDDMIWRGPAGIGTKDSLKRFQDEHQRPFLHAFSDKKAIEEINIAEDEIVASSGYQEATHTGEWLGIPASDKQVKIRYMDFWHVDVDEESGERKLAENLVLIDILGVLEQCGYDVNKVLKFVGSKPPEFFEDVE